MSGSLRAAHDKLSLVGEKSDNRECRHIIRIDCPANTYSFNRIKELVRVLIYGKLISLEPRERRIA